MTRSTVRVRRGFTLIELLVVMAIIAALAAMAMLIAPGAMSKDRAALAATQLTGAMQTNRARSQRDGLPRGIRLLVGNPNNGPGIVTEFQHIESPPVFVPNPDGPPQLPPNPNSASWVEFIYTTNPTGAIVSRACVIRNLTSDQAIQIVNAVTIGGLATATLTLPTLGTSHQILNPQTIPAAPAPVAQPDGALFKVAVTLNQYPDGPLGGQLLWRTYHFGVYGPPRALLGESTVQLPQRTCVDLNLSLPAGGAQDYDILFAPSGQLVTTSSTQGAGHVFLWVRDPTQGSPPPPDFKRGGEMIIVVVKAKSGAIGTAPIDQGGTPFSLAQKSVSGQ